MTHAGSTVCTTGIHTYKILLLYYCTFVLLFSCVYIYRMSLSDGDFRFPGTYIISLISAPIHMHFYLYFFNSLFDFNFPSYTLYTALCQ